MNSKLIVSAIGLMGIIILQMSCTDIVYDSPIDPEGELANWLQANPDALGDDDKDGIANYWEDTTKYQPKDSVAPVIKLLGGDTVRIEQGDPNNRVQFYIDQVQVTDNSGLAPTKIEPESDINIFVVNAANAPYTIKYQYVDQSNNIGTATRYVYIFKTEGKDIKPPIITVGEPTMYIQVGTAFVDPGVSVFDERDGAIPSTKVVVTGTVNKDIEGEYTLTYTVADAAGNKGTNTRKVIVQSEPIGPDRTNPVIKLKGADTVKVPANVTMPEFIGTYKDAGATATDNIDGDISAKIRVGSITQLNGKIWYITFDVTDAAGNAAPTIKRIIETPYSVTLTAPIIDLDYPDSTIQLVLATGRAVWKEPGYTASDVVDGDLTKKVIVDSSNLVANLGKIGKYEVLYSVTNSNKLTGTKKRPVEIVDNPFDIIKPDIKLLGRSPDTALAGGGAYKDPGATALDNKDGDITSKITVTGKVDVSRLGKDTLTYSCADLAGNRQFVKRVVYVVSDTTTTDLFVRYLVPSPDPLPTLGQLVFKTFNVDGDGPSLDSATSGLTKIEITWINDPNNKQFQFYFTYNKTPNFKDMAASTTQTFASAKPGMTITGSQVTGLDGKYYVTYDSVKKRLIWVKQDKTFAILLTK